MPFGRSQYWKPVCNFCVSGILPHSLLSVPAVIPLLSLLPELVYSSLSFCGVYLLLSDNSSHGLVAYKNNHLVSHGFCGSGIREWFSCMILTQGFSWSCHKAVGWMYSLVQPWKPWLRLKFPSKIAHTHTAWVLHPVGLSIWLVEQSQKTAAILPKSDLRGRARRKLEGLWTQRGASWTLWHCNFSYVLFIEHEPLTTMLKKRGTGCIL